MSYIPKSLKDEIDRNDRRYCSDCLTSETNSGIPLTYDHILPRSKGGENIVSNVCLACYTCNQFKSDTTDASDPLTGQTVGLFNPRAQNWTEHFSWTLDFTKIQGLTAVGRATTVTLKMNNPLIVEARLRWTINGWHPPSIRS